MDARDREVGVFVGRDRRDLKVGMRREQAQ
jgi:hypothetical protein